MLHEDNACYGNITEGGTNNSSKDTYQTICRFNILVPPNLTIHARTPVAVCSASSKPFFARSHLDEASAQMSTATGCLDLTDIPAIKGLDMRSFLPFKTDITPFSTKQT